MHWFCRAAIAVGSGGICGVLWNGPVLHLVRSIAGWPVAYCIQIPLMKIGLPQTIERQLGIAAWRPLVSYPPAIIAGLVTYHMLTRHYSDRPPGGETRCRKCGYILRGITEPRCPECGERI